MNNFQNFGDLDDNSIRQKLRELLVHRATVNQKDFALFDEEIDKDIAKDNDESGEEEEQDDHAFDLHETMGTGKPTHMCECEGGKVRRNLLKKYEKISRKPKSEAVQEKINEIILRRNLKPKGKLIKGITKYNNARPIDIEENLKRKIGKMKEKRIFNEAKYAAERAEYGLPELKKHRELREHLEQGDPYVPSDEDEEWMGSGLKNKWLVFLKMHKGKGYSRVQLTEMYRKKGGNPVALAALQAAKPVSEFATKLTDVANQAAQRREVKREKLGTYDQKKKKKAIRFFNKLKRQRNMGKLPPNLKSDDELWAYAITASGFME
jgi:hypothetical protein